MRAETLSQRLEQYKIGEKLRLLRQGKELGLVQLGQHTGLSPGMLSKIERGQLFPTLQTLLRIAMVFEVGLDHFFVQPEKRRAFEIVRCQERLRLPDRPDNPAPTYFFESLDFPVANRRISAFKAVFSPGAEASVPHEHAGEELIFVISGRLAVSVEGERIVLNNDDALHLDANVIHNYQADAEDECVAMIAIASAGAE